MTKPVAKHYNLLYAVAMRQVNVRLDAATIAFYRERGNGNLSRGIRMVAEDAERERVAAQEPQPTGG